MLRARIAKFGVGDIFEKNVQQLPRANLKPPDPLVLKLYREVIKATSEFDWTDDKGRLWRDVLRKSAREEFEMSREESDPFVLHQMIVTAREAITVLKAKVANKRFDLQQKLLNNQFNEFDKRN